jgi:hypothetical protein
MRFLPLIALMMLAAACGSLADDSLGAALPSIGYRYLSLLADETFDDPAAWRSFDGGADLYMAAEDGVYRIRLHKRQFVWVQSPARYQDSIIEAEVRQLSDFDHNAFGIACRLDLGNSGRGYYFLIGGDGYYSIRWSNGRSLDAIVPARPSAAIQRGGAANRIRAVCIKDYLALWINDRFVAEARDQRVSTGAVGLAAAMNYQGKSLDIRFDDLRVWDAMLE